jgi:hypothetical protein
MGRPKGSLNKSTLEKMARKAKEEEERINPKPEPKSTPPPVVSEYKMTPPDVEFMMRWLIELKSHYKSHDTNHVIDEILKYLEKHKVSP